MTPSTGAVPAGATRTNVRSGIWRCNSSDFSQMSSCGCGPNVTNIFALDASRRPLMCAGCRRKLIGTAEPTVSAAQRTACVSMSVGSMNATPGRTPPRHDNKLAVWRTQAPTAPDSSPSQDVRLHLLSSPSSVRSDHCAPRRIEPKRRTHCRQAAAAGEASPIQTVPRPTVSATDCQANSSLQISSVIA